MTALVLPKFVEAPDYFSDVYARPLSADDSLFFRHLRLEALKREGHLFGGRPLGVIDEIHSAITSYETEHALPLDWWKTICTVGKDRAAFGLFDEDDLIGITMAYAWDRDKNCQTAIYRGTYIKPSYRGKGLSHDLAQLRKEWAARRFNEVVFFIREDNAVSRNINEGHGEVYLRTEHMLCADGQYADWRWYRLGFKELALGS